MNGFSYPSSASPPHAQRPLQQYPPIQPNGYPPHGYPQNQNPYQFYPPNAQHQQMYNNSSSPPPTQQSPYQQFKVPRPAEGKPSELGSHSIHTSAERSSPAVCSGTLPAVLSLSPASVIIIRHASTLLITQSNEWSTNTRCSLALTSD